MPLPVVLFLHFFDNGIQTKRLSLSMHPNNYMMCMLVGRLVWFLSVSLLLKNFLSRWTWARRENHRNILHFFLRFKWKKRAWRAAKSKQAAKNKLMSKRNFVDGCIRSMLMFVISICTIIILSRCALALLTFTSWFWTRCCRRFVVVNNISSLSTAFHAYNVFYEHIAIRSRDSTQRRGKQIMREGEWMNFSISFTLVWLNIFMCVAKNHFVVLHLFRIHFLHLMHFFSSSFFPRCCTVVGKCTYYSSK